MPPMIWMCRRDTNVASVRSIELAIQCVSCGSGGQGQVPRSRQPSARAWRRARGSRKSRGLSGLGTARCRGSRPRWRPDPYEISQVLLISRCQLQALNNDNAAYAMHPSGTGPYRFSRMVPHERLELVPNRDYWDHARVPKHDRLVLLPMPEAITRVTAMLAGQVNLIEAPPPDTIPASRAQACR